MQQTEREYLQHIKLAKVQYPEHIKSGYESIRKIWAAQQKMGKRYEKIYIQSRKFNQPINIYKCATSLVIRMQINTPVTYHPSPTRLAKIEKEKTTILGKMSSHRNC